MAKHPAIGIAAVEKETGLSKDCLRAWERRYGFPKPERDADNERVYPAEQVEKLHLVRRLMAAGFRPGKIIDKSAEELRTLALVRRSAAKPKEQFKSSLDNLVRVLRTHDARLLREGLRWHLARMGIYSFVTDIVANLTTTIGDLWANGKVSIWEEHFYSEQIEAVLRDVIAAAPAKPKGPKVLLTTVPGELHKLGLLMVEALLSLDGVKCLPLGTQSPLSEIVRAATQNRVDIVALSFSRAFPVKAALARLTELRAALPRKISLWAGGNGIRGVRKAPDGIVMPMNLASIAPELQRWNVK